MMRDQIIADYKKYRRKREDLSVRPHAVELAEAVLAHTQGDLARVLGHESHTDYVLGYIEKEQANIGDRDEPLCTCGSGSCPLLNNRLPRRIRKADDVLEGISAFRQEHNGAPKVLLEARDSWHELNDRVRNHVSVAHAILVQGTEPAKGTVEDVEEAMAQPGEYPLPRDIESEEVLLG